MNNLDIWNKINQTPKQFLKEIKFGYLKGKSDINPQWRLMAMTQAFGPVGHGWTYRIVKMWSESCATGAVMAFAEVAVKTKLNGQWGEEFSGIGGSEIVEKNKNGISPNDEGYKKAVTDALSVAFKAVGVAADIYLGNFDGSKYKENLNQAYYDQDAELKNAALRLESATSLDDLRDIGSEYKGTLIYPTVREMAISISKKFKDNEVENNDQ